MRDHHGWSSLPDRAGARARARADMKPVRWSGTSKCAALICGQRLNQRVELEERARLCAPDRA